MPGDSPAIIVFDQNGNAIEVIQDSDGYYRLAVDSKISGVDIIQDDSGDNRLAVDSSISNIDIIQDSDGYDRLATNNKVIEDPFSVDRDKLVAVNLGKSGISTTTYYVLIDLDDADYKHDITGTDVILSYAGGTAVKSKSTDKWKIELMVVLFIDGTSANLAVLPITTVSLEYSGTFIQDRFVNIFPNVLNLTVFGGDFLYSTNGLSESSVTAVNTGVTFENAAGNNVIPAVGDVLLRVTLVDGNGTVDFTYGSQYWVE